MATARRAFLHWFDDVRRDILYGSRTLARTPGFRAVAVTTLALGISAVTVIYSVVRNVVLDPFRIRVPSDSCSSGTSHRTIR